MRFTPAARRSRRRRPVVATGYSGASPGLQHPQAPPLPWFGPTEPYFRLPVRLQGRGDQRDDAQEEGLAGSEVGVPGEVARAPSRCYSRRSTSIWPLSPSAPSLLSGGHPPSSAASTLCFALLPYTPQGSSTWSRLNAAPGDPVAQGMDVRPHGALRSGPVDSILLPYNFVHGQPSASSNCTEDAKLIESSTWCARSPRNPTTSKPSASSNCTEDAKLIESSTWCARSPRNPTTSKARLLIIRMMSLELTLFSHDLSRY